MSPRSPRSFCAQAAMAAVLVGTTCLTAGALAGDGRAAELVRIVRQDCGSCHGLTLQGGLGPALTAAALRDRPAEAIAATILHGRPGTPMPPFRGILDDADVRWITRQLVAGFPNEGDVAPGTGVH